MLAEDMLTVNVGVELFALAVVARESLCPNNNKSRNGTLVAAR